MPTKRTTPARARFNFDSSLITDTWAIDTETTGLDFRVPLTHQSNPTKRFQYAARAFAVTLFDPSNRDTYYWDWPVDPKTRRVIYKQSDILEIRRLLQDRKHWVFHNAGHDIRGLLHASILSDTILSRRWQYIHDTLPASHVLDSQESHALKDLAEKYCGIDTADEADLHSRVKQCRRSAPKDFPLASEWQSEFWLPKHFNPSDNSCQHYCINDGIRTGVLWQVQLMQLHSPANADSFGRLPWHHYCREQALIRDTFEMENQGIHIRPGTFAKFRSELSAVTADAWGRMTKIAKRYRVGGKDGSDFNPRSTPQKQALLFSEAGFNLPVLARTKTKQPSTSAATLDDLTLLLRSGVTNKKGHKHHTKHTQAALDFLETYSLYQSNQTALSYLNSYDEHKVEVLIEHGDIDYRRHFLFPSFNQNGTRTTRYSSENPNGQNFGGRDIESEDDTADEAALTRKRRIRDIAGPPPGRHWYASDWNQLELRIMAKASGDPNLNRCLNDNIDRHQLTCDAINVIRSSLNLGPISRKIAKNINFAWQYGAGAPKLGKMAGINAREFRLAMQTAYPGVLEFMSDCADFAKRHGYIETLFGYRLYIPPPTYLDFDEDGDEADRLIEYWYKATNYRIQGTAGDLAKNAMLSINRFLRKSRLDSSIQLLMQIHDELLFQTEDTVTASEMHALRRMMEDAGKPINLTCPAELSFIKTSWGQPKKLPKLIASYPARTRRSHA